MTYIHNPSIAWISEDGSYSAGNEIIFFKGNELALYQWDILSTLPDSERIIYAMAVINGEDVSDWEDEFEDE